VCSRGFDRPLELKKKKKRISERDALNKQFDNPDGGLNEKLPAELRARERRVGEKKRKEVGDSWS